MKGLNVNPRKSPLRGGLPKVSRVDQTQSRVNFHILTTPFMFDNRETIMRLVSEVGQGKKASSASQQTIDALTRERDSLQQKVREMEIHAEQLNIQLVSSQDAWSSTQKELDKKDSK